MTKQFKAGDKVRAYSTSVANRITGGRVYEVTAVSGNGDHAMLTFKNDWGHVGGAYAYRFELVESKPAPKFKAGDKVRIITDKFQAPEGDWNKGAVCEVVSFDEKYNWVDVTACGGVRGLLLVDEVELLTEPQQEFIVTRVYPNGGYGVTHYFATEQEAREYLQKSGNADGGYKLSRLADSQLLKVREETTVTRTVEAA